MAIYSFIAEEQANNSIWHVTEMCRVLEVSRSGFCEWQGRGPSDRDCRTATPRMVGRATEIEARMFSRWMCSM